MALAYYLFAERGFDNIDDGYNLLQYNNAAYYTTGLHTYNIFINKIFGDRVENIVFLRRINIGIFAVSALFLSVSTYRLLAGNRSIINFVYILVFILNGSLLTLQDRLINYNSINLLISSFAFSSFFISVKRLSSINIWLIVISGLLMGIQFHIKLTTSILLLTCLGFSTIFMSSFKQYAVLLGSFIFSVLLFAFLIHGNADSWILFLNTGISNTKLEGYGSSEHLISFFGTILIDGTAVFLCYFIFKYIINFFTKTNLSILHRIGILALAWLIMLSLTKETTPITVLYRSGSLFFYKLPSLISGINLLLLSNSYRINTFYSRLRPQFIYATLSLLLPVIIEFGGMSNPHLAAGTYNIFWINSIIICLDRFKSNKNIFFVSVMILTITISVFTHNHLLYPTRIPTSLFDQNKMLSGHKIKVDGETLNYLSGWKKIITKHRLNENKNLSKLLFLHNEAGTVYLLGKISPVIPLYLNINDDRSSDLEDYSADFNSFILEKYRIKEDSEIIIACSKDFLKSKIAQQTINRRTLIDSIFSPFQQNDNTSTNVYIYK